MMILSTNVGIVIFVGIAARLTIRVIPIAIIPAIHKIKLLPVIPIVSITSGVIMQPCDAKDRASHPKWFFSCASHHLKNLLNKVN